MGGGGPSKLEVVSPPPWGASFSVVVECMLIKVCAQPCRSGRPSRQGGAAAPAGPLTFTWQMESFLSIAVSDNGFPAASYGIFFCFKFFCPPNNAVISLVTDDQSPAAELLRSIVAIGTLVSRPSRGGLLEIQTQLLITAAPPISTPKSRNFCREETII